MVRTCVTWDVLLVLLNPPQDLTSCRAGARPGHPISGLRQCSKRRTWVARAGERGEAYPTFDCDAPGSILGLMRPRPGMTACEGTSISLGARLCHLAARLAHSGGCGIRHQPRVAENRAELVSLTETSNGRLGSIGMHARDHAALAGSRADGLDRRQHFWVLRIEGRRLPHAEREVRGSDIDTIETLD